eukprot:4091309-Ditylum_brightwellii.AAC.1
MPHQVHLQPQLQLEQYQEPQQRLIATSKNGLTNSMRKKSSTRCGKAAKRANVIPSIDNQAAHRNLKRASWMMVQMKARQENHTLIQ